MTETLLEKAKKTKSRFHNRSGYSKEEIDVALAWALGEISITQVSSILPKNKSITTAYTFLAKCLKQHLQTPE